MSSSYYRNAAATISYAATGLSNATAAFPTTARPLAFTYVVTLGLVHFIVDKLTLKPPFAY